jgi:DNA-binding transcriptional ArsR family regulator
MTEKLENLAKKLQLAGDSNRMKILCLMFDSKRICVSEIAQKLNLSVAIVSHHLQALADEGLAVPERNGKMVCYQIEQSDFMKDLKKMICKYK